ncbi:MAG: molybdenum cofactor guanylyltransferase [Candidatus Pelagadaptatus aseana]
MGTDKALLCVNGRNQMDRSREWLLQAGCDAVVISRNTPDISHTIADQYTNQGPLGGIHAVVKAHPQAKAFLILPVDMPQLGVPLLQQLMQQPHSCFYQDSLFPCLIHNSAELVTQLEQRLDSDQLRVKPFLKAIGANAITSSQMEQLQNTNTPAEWQAAVNPSHTPSTTE